MFLCFWSALELEDWVSTNKFELGWMDGERDGPAAAEVEKIRSCHHLPSVV